MHSPRHVTSKTENNNICHVVQLAKPSYFINCELTKHLMEAIQKLSVKFRQKRIHFILNLEVSKALNESIEWHNFSRKIVWYCRLPLRFPLMLTCIFTVRVSDLR